MRELLSALRHSAFGLFYESYFAQLLLLAVLVFFPQILYFFKRMAFAVALSRRCRLQGFTLCAHRRLWFLGSFSRADCEFSLLTPAACYAVKLVGAARKSHHLFFHTSTAYSRLRTMRLMARGASRRDVPPVTRTHPEWRFFTRLDTPRPVTPVVLLCPDSAGVFATERVEGSGVVYQRPLRGGERLFSAFYFTRESFFRLLDMQTPRDILFDRKQKE